MKRKASATAMSKEWMQDHGYLVALTEQNIRIPDKTSPTGWRMFKRDLWNIADLIGVDANKNGVLLVQSTIGMNNKPERMQKILDAPATRPLLDAHNEIELHIWRKLKPRGERVRWQLARYKLKSLFAGNGLKLQWVDYSEAKLGVEVGPLFTQTQDTVEGDW